MKKKILASALAFLCVGLLAACGNNQKEKDDSVLTVGASPTPHAEILEQVKPILKEEGIELKIVKFDDYVLPNKALADQEIDANYFQHQPYLNLQIKENGYDFVSAGNIHIEPMGLYSKRIKNISELKEGAQVIASNSESDWGRIITILQNAGLVTVKEGTDLETATFEDIDENPKNLTFVHNVNPELLATTYENDEADLVAINANFAYASGLNPLEEAVLLESDQSPYANVIAARSEDKDNPAIQKLVDALHQKAVQDWIIEKWGGSIKPVSE